MQLGQKVITWKILIHVISETKRKATILGNQEHLEISLNYLPSHFTDLEFFYCIFAKDWFIMIASSKLNLTIRFGY